MLFGVKDRFVFGLVFCVWLVKCLAPFEVGSASFSVPHKGFVHFLERLTLAPPSPNPPLPIPPKHHSPPYTLCSMS